MNGGLDVQLASMSMSVRKVEFDKHVTMDVDADAFDMDGIAETSVSPGN
jgi:hypothetical protein